MPAPLVGIAVAAAAKMAAKKLAGNAAKKTVTKKVATKAANKLTKDEKFAVKFAKDIAKKGKPGDVRKTLDAMSPSAKKDFSKALRKAAGDKSAIYKQTPKAPAKAMVVKSRSTGKTKRINLS
jgi:predicted metal-dependent peptidase